jgi:hypothetical protein
MTTIDLVPDQLWSAVQPLLPPEPPKPKAVDLGKPTGSERAIVFMLRRPALAAAARRAAQPTRPRGRNRLVARLPRFLECPRQTREAS